MNRQEQRNAAPVVGGSSLLVIFAVLCLTVFALLGLSTVQADGRLSDISALAVTDYYTADSMAEEILAQLRSGEIPDGVAERDGVYTYACRISDTGELQVAVKINGGDYEILRWQAVTTSEWTANDALSVWDGES
ncbi:MAG: hypothetical protein IJD81_01580 [Oscillospiraceae bacterium]|nr:hypothetical protein [Oscillospiraceae bacterium]